MNNKSFSLIETLTAIVIIGLLAGFIIVKFEDSNVAAEISRGKAFGLSLLTSLPMNLIAEWKFDGPTAADSAATVNDVKDTIGFNDGSVNGGVLMKDGSDCVSGKCLQFDGVDDFVTIIDSDDNLDLPGNYTISFWAYNGNGTKTYPTLFNKAGQSSSNGFFWCYSSGTNEASIRYQWSTGSAYTSTIFSNVFDLNKWNYLVFTFVDLSKTLKLYKNGLYTNDPKTLTSALPVDDGNLYIGTYNGSTSSYPFQGKIDEFRMFNEVLSVSQIQNNYFIGFNKLLLNNQISKEEYNQRLIELNNNLTKYE
jgi:hypothetical protein